MKKVTLVLTTLLLTFTAFSQVELENEVISDISNYLPGVSTLNAVDIDGDGDLDMLGGGTLAGVFNVAISWYENLDGLGTYGDQRIIETIFNEVSDVISADIDNDGDLDVIATSNSNNPRISWYENLDGLGNFGSRQNISSAATGAKEINAVDLDLDGDIDIVASPIFTNEIVWYENTDGLGDFTFEQSITENPIPISELVLIDIDGDTDADIIATMPENETIVLLENLDDSALFGTPQIISTSAVGSPLLASFDIDDDGDSDLIAASQFEAKIVYHENVDGLGTYGEEIVISTSTSVRNLKIENIDNDFDFEIVFSFVNSLMYINSTLLNGELTFDNEPTLLTSTIGIIEDYNLSDINNDGSIDILTHSPGNNFVFWLSNNGDGNFNQEDNIAYYLFDQFTGVSGDFNNDGDTDHITLLVHNGGLTTLEYLEKRDGTEKYIPHRILFGFGNISFNISSGDINNDGNLDLVLTNPADNSLSWLENINDGSSFETQFIESDSNNNLTEIKDLDGDGDLDIIKGLRWFENLDGLGNFSASIAIGNLPYSSDFEISDIDGDADLDIIAFTDTDEIYWFENNGDATSFTENLIDPNFITPLKLTVVDMDSDGDFDIVALRANSFKFFENIDGSGNFNIGPFMNISSTVTNIDNLKSIDLDEDEKKDLVVFGSIADNKEGVVYFRNTGNNEFLPGQIIIEVDGRFDYINAINNAQDGSPEIIVSYNKPFPLGDEIVLYKNFDQLSTPIQLVDLFSIYPNPVTNDLRITSNYQISNVKVYDVLGKLVLQKSDAISINLNTLSKGIYYIEITDSQGHVGTEKVIKE